MSARYGVVSLACLDLRVRPDHRSELASQLLLGEIVRLGRARAGWRRVTNLVDGDSGWVREWGLVVASAARAARWRALAAATVRAPIAALRGRPGAGIGVGPLFLGGLAIPGRRRRGWIEVELPDARRGWVERAAVALPAERPPAIAERVTSLLGTPYLWGGRTPAGYDCSAFVQQVLLEQGISLPRDAGEQRRACRPLGSGQAPAPGDLAFFADGRGRVAHVGLALGEGLFAHSRGRVALASLDPANKLYDKELAPQMLGWFRASAGPS